MKKNSSEKRRKRRHEGIRKKIFGTLERPRLSFYKTNRHIYAQVINDLKGITLTSASSLELRKENLSNKEKTIKTAQVLAERLKKLNINQIVFDRGGFSYKGRTKEFAEALRNFGINF